MARSKWKGFFFKNSVYSSLVSKSKVLGMVGRQNILIKDFENLLLKVSNGKSNVSFIVNENMLGFFLKDFSLTRKSFVKRKN